MARSRSEAPDIPGFQYVELLGSGGFADVFLYDQKMPRRFVAVKVMLRGIGERARLDFEVEANLMAKLSNHPNIVSIHSAGIADDGRPYLVMEYCPPPHLGQRVKTDPLSVSEALDVTIQLAGAVETAHRLMIVHRDIKPSNVMLTQFGRPALTDFGISVSLDEGNHGGTGMSVPWGPPEQMSTDAKIGPEADIYSLAASMFTFLTGRAPYQVEGSKNEPAQMLDRLLNKPVPKVNRPDVPSSLQDVLQVAMAKEPSRRFGRMEAFARALQKIQVEMGERPTVFDVIDEEYDGEEWGEEAEATTRLRGFKEIQPQSQPGGGEPSPPAPKPARPKRPAVGTDTRARLPMVKPTRASFVFMRWVALVLVAGLSLIVIAWAVLQQEEARVVPVPTQNPVPPTPDPVGITVAPPRDVSAVMEGTKLRLRWVSDVADGGQTYLVKLVDPLASTPVEEVEVPEALVEVSASGRTCFEVRTRLSNGRTSEPTVGCFPK